MKTVAYAKVTSNLKKLNEISKEQLSYNPTVLERNSVNLKRIGLLTVIASVTHTATIMVKETIIQIALLI